MAESDQPTTPGQPQPGQPQPQIHIVQQYVRDLSFENVAAQKGTHSSEKPEIKVSVNLDAKPKGEDRYEISLILQATSVAGDTTLFVCELDYAGLFSIKNVPQEHLHPLLLIECPRQIFPFARRIISDVTRDGGFPPLMLDMIDFVGIYRQELARRQAAQNQQPAGTA